jgi:hypothetical protein
MFIETRKNEFGTPVDAYRCDTCGDEFTVCPANDDRSRDEDWSGCMALTCASYNPRRDADKFFDDGDVISLERRRPGGIRVDRRPVK